MNTVEMGILALANAVEQNPDEWFAGHVGASLLAGAAMVSGDQLAEVTKRKLAQWMERQVQKHKDFLEPQQAITLTTDFIEIEDAIALNAEQLSRSGHGVIYGALFLHAVAHNSVAVTEWQVKNIARLIRNCSNDNWNRYFGVTDYRQYQIAGGTDSGLDSILISAVNRSADAVYLDTKDNYFAGERIHGITHAHAIYLLQGLGYESLALKAAQQLRVQLELNDLKPESGLIKADPKAFDLSDAGLFSAESSHEHQIKLAHSYSDLYRYFGARLSPLDNLWGAIS